jgi:serine/threonine protein kinase
MAQPYTILGRGGYGVAVDPALPNQDAAGQEVQYPGEITKFFVRKANYDKALSNAANLRSRFPTEVSKIAPYTKPFTLANTTSIPGLKLDIERVAGKGYLPSNTPVYPIHMPNLGFSLYDCYIKPNVKAKLQALNPLTIAHEILKSLKVVGEINGMGYIHGDIRERNVLLNPDTGQLTIIDFDLFQSADSFLEKNYRFMYHMPIEYIFVKRGQPSVVDKIWNIHTPAGKAKVRQYIEDDIEPELASIQAFRGFTIEEYKKHLITLFNYQFTKYVEPPPTAELKLQGAHNGADEIIEKMKQSFDLYGFGFCVRYMIKYIFINPKFKILNDFLVGITQEWCNPVCVVRSSVEKAIANMTTFFEATYGPLEDIDPAAEFQRMAAAADLYADIDTDAAPALPPSPNTAGGKRRRRATKKRKQRGHKSRRVRRQKLF